MSFYQSTTQLNECVQTAFRQLQPADFASLQKANLVIRLVCHDPPAEIWINGQAEPVTVHTHQPAGSPDANFTIWLDGDTLHHILLGQQGIMKAIGRKKVKFKGSMFKARALSPLFKQTQTIYPAVLRTAGLL